MCFHFSKLAHRRNLLSVEHFYFGEEPGTSIEEEALKFLYAEEVRANQSVPVSHTQKQNDIKPPQRIDTSPVAT